MPLERCKAVPHQPHFQINKALDSHQENIFLRHSGTKASSTLRRRKFENGVSRPCYAAAITGVLYLCLKKTWSQKSHEERFLEARFS